METMETNHVKLCSLQIEVGYQSHELAKSSLSQR